MNTNGLKISPRALALAMQNQIDVMKITPTGPDGRIIERDVLRMLEKEYLADTAEQSIVNKEEKEVVREEMKEIPVAEEALVKDTEEDREETTEPEETPDLEVEILVENDGTSAEEPELEVEITVEEAEETAIVAAPMIAVASEKSEKEEPDEKPKEKTYAYGTEAYRHTDVIISRTETMPEYAPMTISMSFDASAISGLHQKIKENGESLGLPHITINDMILFASAKILKKNKILNAHFLGDKIRYFDGVHLGFVVDTGHGMETPTVFDAERLSLSALSKITGALIRGARAGGVSPEKNKLCASFMVSNLGTLGVEQFAPVLKEPQTGVLGVCAMQRRIKSVGSKDVSYPCIPLSLTFDPRALDTTSAAKFLRELCASLENFELLLIK